MGFSKIILDTVFKLHTKMPSTVSQGQYTELVSTLGERILSRQQLNNQNPAVKQPKPTIKSSEGVSTLFHEQDAINIV